MYMQCNSACIVCGYVVVSRQFHYMYMYMNSLFQESVHTLPYGIQ